MTDMCVFYGAVADCYDECTCVFLLGKSGKIIESFLDEFQSGE